MSQATAAKEIIETLITKGIRVLAIDFDKTIVKVHTAGFWTQGTPKLAEEVRPCFKELIQEALASNLSVCIVTYSMQPALIHDVLKHILPKTCDVGKILIRANSTDWLPVSNMSAHPHLGKQNHIAWICTEIYYKRHVIIEPHEILLLDDDSENVSIAREFGHCAYEVKDDVNLDVIKEFVVKDLKVEKRSAVQ